MSLLWVPVAALVAMAVLIVPIWLMLVLPAWGLLVTVVGGMLAIGTVTVLYGLVRR